MIGQLPAEFFTRFFTILNFKPTEAEDFQTRLNDLCQRAFLYKQLEILPEAEQRTFSESVEQDGISAGTVNEFIEAQIEPSVKEALWQQSLLQVWQEVLEVVGKTASKKQKDEIRALLREYSGD